MSNKITAEVVERAIGAFVAAITTSKAAAQEAAIAALTHAFQHRDAVYLRRLLAVIENEGKDFVRRAPFTLWLRAFAPVKMVSTEIEGKKVRQLEFDTASELLAREDEVLAAAAETPWWTMSQDKELGAFDVFNFDKRILGIAKKALADLEKEEGANPLVLNHVNGVLEMFSRYVELGKGGKIVQFNTKKAAEKQAA